MLNKIGLTAAEDWQRKTSDLRTKLLAHHSQRTYGMNKKLVISQVSMFRGDVCNCDTYLSIQTKFTETKLEYKLVYTISAVLLDYEISSYV